MANHIPSEQQCPNCGHDEVTVDTSYSDELKRNDFHRRLFRDPTVWILLLFAFVDLFLLDMPIELRGAIAVVLLASVIVGIVRSYRALYGVGAAVRYPGDRCTCNRCGHRWTFQQSQTAVAYETGARNAAAEITPRGTAEDRASEPTTSGPRGAQEFQRILATGASKFDWGNCLLIAVLLALLGVLGIFVLLGLLLR